MNNGSKLVITGITSLVLLIAGCSSQNDEMLDTSMGGVSESFFSPGNNNDSAGLNDGSNPQRSGSYSTQSRDGANSVTTQSGSGSMDRVDNLNLNNALSNQSNNRTTTWVNPKTNKRYTVTPKSTDNTDGSYCRTYTMNTIIDGQSQTVTGKSCRINGQWVKQ